MSYDKMRYLEQLLSSIYSDGAQEHRKEIESYFEENYGEDSLVKPVLDIPEKKEVIKTTKTKLSFPDDLEEKLSAAVNRVFKGSK